MGWFGRKPSADASDDGVIDVEPLDGAPAASARGSKGGFSVKGLKRSRKKDRRLTAYFKMSSREVYWNLSPDDGSLMSQVGEDERVDGDIISFSSDDDRELLTESRDNESSMKKKIMSDVGAEVVMVSTLKKDGWVYATPLSRVRDVNRGTRIYSGKLILRTLLAQSGRAPADGPFALGAAFRGGQNVTALVMFKVDEAGALTKMQYVPVPGESIEGSIRNFIQTARLSASGEYSADRIIVFSEEDVHDALSLIKPYPEELAVAGVSLLVWGRLGIAGSSLALAGTLGYSGLLAYQAKTISAQASAMRAQTLQSRDAAKQLYLDRLPTILSKTNLSLRTPIEISSKIYIPGGLVDFVSERSLTTYKVSLPISTSREASEIAGALNFEPAPEGCSRKPVESNRSMSDLQVIYECPSSNSLAEFLLGGGS